MLGNLLQTLAVKPNIALSLEASRILYSSTSSYLNTHCLDKGATAKQSESEGDMSDSEMLAINEQLAAALARYIAYKTERCNL